MSNSNIEYKCPKCSKIFAANEGLSSIIYCPYCRASVVDARDNDLRFACQLYLLKAEFGVKHITVVMTAKTYDSLTKTIVGHKWRNSHEMFGQEVRVFNTVSKCEEIKAVMQCRNEPVFYFRG